MMSRWSGVGSLTVVSHEMVIMALSAKGDSLSAEIQARLIVFLSGVAGQEPSAIMV